MTGHAIAVVNLSQRVSSQDALAIADAVSRQQAEDVCPAWGVPHRPINIYSSVSELPPLTTDVAVIQDEPGDPGTLGWHSAGIAPFGRVFVNPILDNGGCVLYDDADPQRISVASVFSHEFGCELPVDPECVLYAIDGAGNEYDLEIADPVQRSQYTRVALMPWGNVPVAVSNFVLPAWYQRSPPVGSRYDHIGVLSRPFEIEPGGYAMVNGSPVFARTAAGVSYPPAWRLASRPPGARRGLQRARLEDVSAE